MGYVSIDKLAKVRIMCKKVLPAVYDESLSYLEGLSKLTFKLNETINGVNQLNENVDALNDSVTELNARVEAVEGEIDGFETEVTERVNQLEISLTEKIDNSVAEMETKVDEKLATVDTEIENIDTRVTELEEYVRTTLDTLIEEFRALINVEIERIKQLYEALEDELKDYVQQQIDELIKEIPDLTNIYVVSPTSGKLVKVQVAIDDVFAFSLYNALTCDEINELAFSCNKINSLMVKSIPRGFSIFEWLHDAKKLLVDQVPLALAEKWVQPHSIVRNFLTGAKCWLKKNTEINEAMWAWGGSFTCDEIVTNGFTCDEIIGFEISCEDYILRANEIMVTT